MQNSEFRAGRVAIIGRPNVGKSTLINKLIGYKIAIASDRPQTTRNRILGILDQADAQIVFMDTPGIHKGKKRVFNRMMNRAVSASMEGIDLALFLIEGRGWQAEDEIALDQLKKYASPAILVINKIDMIKDKSRLLPLFKASSERFSFVDLVPVSARSGDNTDTLINAIKGKLPKGSPLFPQGKITDQDDMFFAAELVREKISQLTYHEVPYNTAVKIEQWKDTPKLLRIEAMIWVEKTGQKAILIGKKGERLKQIGTNARQELEKTFGKKVYLGLWVKVRRDWSENPANLRELGYLDG